MPADLVGTRIWRPVDGGLRRSSGARSSPTSCWPTRSTAPRPRCSRRCSRRWPSGRSRSAATTRRLPAPFLVLATQNPIESEGVYALPEAQRDRFLMHVVVPQPTYEEETAIAQRMSARHAAGRAGADPRAARRAAGRRATTCSSTTPCRTTRCAWSWRPASRRAGAWRTSARSSPSAPARAAPSACIASARALAVLRGRRFVVPQDVYDVAPEVLRHRDHADLRRARRGRRTPTTSCAACSATCPAPRVAPQQDELRSHADRRVRPDADPGRRMSERPAARVGVGRRGRHPGAVLRRLELEVLRRLDGSASGDHLTVAIGPGHRAGRRPRVRAGRRRPAHRLEPHGPVGADPRADDRGRARGRHLDRRRPLGEPRLRHGPRGEARRRARRGRGLRHAHRARPQPPRAARRRRTVPQLAPAAKRPRLADGRARGDPRHPAAGRRPGRGLRPRGGDASPAGGAAAPQPDRGDLRLPRPRQLGRSRCAASRCGTRSSPCTSPTRASSSCPPSASSPSSTPRPVGSGTSRPRRRRCASATRRPRSSGTRGIARAIASQPAPSTSTCPRPATGSPTPSGSRPAASGGVAPRRGLPRARDHSPAASAASTSHLCEPTMTFLSAWRLVLLVAPVALLVAYVACSGDGTPRCCASPASTCSTPSRPSGPAGSGTSRRSPSALARSC